MRINGPYTRKTDYRQFMVIIHDDGSRTTKSYARFLIEKHLGRELSKEETVDHINGDRTDDRLENLQVLSVRENMTKSAFRHNLTCVCPMCGDTFAPTRSQRATRVTEKKAGPFCSRSCA